MLISEEKTLCHFERTRLYPKVPSKRALVRWMSASLQWLYPSHGTGAIVVPRAD